MAEDSVAVAAVRAGDESAFTALTERYRRELQVHCYRMLGSLEESEDLVQETFLRAWRGREGFEGRSTFRGWLYRIATNACLDVLDQRPRRVLPYEVAPVAGTGTAPFEPADHPWLEPYPDHLLPNVTSDEDAPDAVVVAKETIELAFLAAIQHLPPRQRAVLILRDVLGWTAGDTAATLELTVAAVKSALQRARSTLRKHLPRQRSQWGPVTDPSAAERALLQRYMDAHQRRDTHVLAGLLREDVRVSFPPLPFWVEGSQAFITGSTEFAAAGEYRYLATRSNLQPAVAVYLRRPQDSEFRALALEVLRVEEGKITEIVDFSSPAVLEAFGLPATLVTRDPGDSFSILSPSQPTMTRSRKRS
ncbi:RNA polymerase subunit sigma-70 [Acrocarpospora macrocephala]|uniref:RNA polymerase sigma factor n=1 Tax=Acrocarpospora macrocephala TaxID=150177 RepID=A0A5M3WGT2_9ACTN|nr:sigma-70 family RNA polymerase sigma factor [Acrocarpospora macrocephala]GES08355.1 RNA polymerase sigma factor [Acrocarpospora macrocephala]